MSTSKAASQQYASGLISQFEYRQLISPEFVAEEEPEPEVPTVTMTEDEFRSRIAAERAAAGAQVEGRLRQQYEDRTKADSAKIAEAIEQFQQSRREYFAKVEAEVVQLALSIAGKILHREAQVDPLLVAAAVQIALGQLKEGSAATIRVRPQEARRWHDCFASADLKTSVTIVEDADLQPGDCMLETEIGNVNFSLNAQLKEVERGFFDVIAQRPQS
jgi:flagellar assembly protein FliH